MSHRHTFARVALGCLAASLGLTASGESTTIRKASLQEYCSVATTIVEGHITSKRQVWEHSIPHTVYELEVSARYKGDAAGKVAFISPGAQDERRIAHVHLAPHFRTGERVVLFLWWSEGWKSNFVLGMTYGVYRFDWTPDGKSQRIRGLHADKSGNEPVRFRAELQRLVGIANQQERQVGRER